MTDNENIKGVCNRKLCEPALEIINRQKAEIDGLKQDTIPKLEWALKRANENGISLERENQELKAEIERLKAEADELAEEYNVLMLEKDKLFDEAKSLIKQAKAEAIREFGKFLIDKSKNGMVSIADIPDYVKEMTEGGNG